MRRIAHHEKTKIIYSSYYSLKYNTDSVVGGIIYAGLPGTLLKTGIFFIVYCGNRHKGGDERPHPHVIRRRGKKTSPLFSILYLKDGELFIPQIRRVSDISPLCFFDKLVVGIE